MAAMRVNTASASMGSMLASIHVPHLRRPLSVSRCTSGRQDQDYAQATGKSEISAHSARQTLSQ